MKKNMRSGQMEIIGLAFVVLLMVLGFFLYLILTLGSDNAPTHLIEEAQLVGVALETAMLETTVESCDYTLATAIERCVTNPQLDCGHADVCEATNTAIDDMLLATLGEPDSDAPARRPFRAYLERSDTILNKDGTDFLYEPYDACTEDSDILAAPSQPIHTSIGEVSLVIEFCG